MYMYMYSMYVPAEPGQATCYIFVYVFFLCMHIASGRVIYM